MSSRLYLAKITVWLLLMLGGYGVVQAQNSITSLSLTGGSNLTAACGGTTITIVPSIQTTNPTTVTAVVYSPVLNGIVQPQFNGAGVGFNGSYTLPGVTTSSTLVVQATGYFSNGTSSTASLTIGIYPSIQTPVSTTVSPAAICAGSSSSITVPSDLTIQSASGPGFLSLVTPTPTNVLNVTTSAAASGIQTYSLVVSNTSGCTALATADLNVNPIPAISITFSNTLLNCTNPATVATANVTPAGSYTYVWSGATSSTTSASSYTYTGTGTGPIAFSVLVTSAGGCTATASASVTADRVAPAAGPSVSIVSAGTFSNTLVDATAANASTSGTVCQGTSLVLSISGCVAQAPSSTSTTNNDPVIFVTGPGGTTIIGASTSTVVAGAPGINVFNIPTNIVTNAGSPFVYTIPCIGANGCQSTNVATLTLTVNPTPAAPAPIAPQVVCAGPVASLTTSCASSTAVFSGATSFTGNSLTVATSGITSATTLTYTVVCTNASGCSSSAITTTLTVNPVPNAAALTVTAGTTTNIAGGTSGSVSVCSGSSLTIATNCLIGTTTNVTAVGSNPPLVGQNTGLNGVDSGTAGVGSGSGSTPGNSTTSLVNASFVGSFTATATQTFVYTLICTNAAGCTSPTATTLSVTVNPQPEKPTFVSNGFAGGLSASSTTLCQTNTVRRFAFSCPTVGTASITSSGSGTGITTTAGAVTLAAGASGVYNFSGICATSSCTSTATTYSFTIVAAPNTPALTVVGSTPTASPVLAGQGASVSVCVGKVLTVNTDCRISSVNAGSGQVVAPGFTGINTGGSNSDSGAGVGGTTGGSSATASPASTTFASFSAVFASATTSPYVYTFNCTNASGCPSLSVTSLTVTVNPTPAQPTAALASATVCAGTPAILTSGCTSSTALFTGGDLGAGSFSGNAYTVVTTGYLSATAATTLSYTVACVNSSSCASDVKIVTVTVNPTPNNASLTVTGGVPASVSVNASNSFVNAVTVCAGSTLTVKTDCQISTSTSTTNPTTNPGFNGINTGVTGVDQGGNGTATTGGGTNGGSTTSPVFASFSATFTESAVASTPYTYTFNCTNTAGCSSLTASTLLVTVVTQPQAPTVSGFASATAPAVVCQSATNLIATAACPTGQTAVVTGTGIVPGTAGRTTSATIAAGSTGVFTYTAVCTNGSCTSTKVVKSLTVVEAAPVATFTTVADGVVAQNVNAVTVCSGKTLVINTNCPIVTSVTGTAGSSNPALTGIGAGNAGTVTNGGSTGSTSGTVTTFASYTGVFNESVTTTYTYTFVCTNTAGCSSTAVSSLAVTVNPTPAVASVAGISNMSVCQSTSPINITATCTSASAVVTGSGAGFIPGTFGTTTTSTIPANATGVYGYTVVCTNATGCSSDSKVYSLTIVPAPNVASITLVNAGTGSLVNASSATVCSGQSLTVLTDCFVSSSTSATTITNNPPFQSGSNGIGGSVGGGVVGGGVTTNSNAFYTATFSSATTQTYVYTLVCTNASGCSSTTVTSFSVTVNPTPAAPTPAATYVACQGTGPISVSANCATGTTLIGGRIAGTTAAGNTTATAGVYTIATSATGVGSYTIACQNSSGCVSEVKTFSVTVNAAPNNATITASASGNTINNVVGNSSQMLTICRNSPVSLTIAGCTSVFIPGQGTISGGISVTNTGAVGGISGGGTAGTSSNTLVGTLPTAGIPTGVYTVTLACQTTAGCTSTLVSSFSLNITDAPAGNVTISGFAAACGPNATNTSGTLSCATGYVSYTVTGGTSITAGTSNVVSITTTGAGVYTIAAQCATAPECAGPISTTAFNNRVATPAPTNIEVSQNTLCAGTTTVLSVSGCIGGIVNWYVQGSNAVIGTGASLTVAPTTSTAYQANCTLNGCTSAKTTAANVTVSPMPSGVPSIQALPNPVAAGASVTLTAFGCPAGSQVIFYTDAAGTVEAGRSATGSLVVNPTVNTTYYGACFNGSCRGIVSTGGTPVTVQACNFVANVTPSSATLCPGGSVVLTSSGGSSYVWSNGAGNVQSITVQAPGVYNVIVTNASGCTALASATVVAGSAPVVGITGNTNIVQGQTAVLTATGGVTYLWNTGATTPTISTQTGGVYSVTVTSLAGCSASGQTTVTVTPLPAAPSVTPGTNLQACLGQNVLLTAACATGTPRFNRGNASFNQPTYSVESPVTGTVSINVVCVVNGVEGTATPVTVAFNASPNVSIAGDGKICVTSGVVTGATLTASGASSYLWSNGATTPSITVTTPGVISVTGTTAGCSNVAQINTFSAVCGTGQALAITGASINCTTRQITINTVGGDGTAIQGRILLVTQFQSMAQPLILDAGVFAERKPVQLQVMQSGVMSPVFTFDYSAQCSGGGTVTPPPTSTTTATGNTITVCGQPYVLTGAPFSVSATFTCNPGTTPHVVNFIPTGGVVDANSVIEFMSIGITPWTQACSETLDLNNFDNNTFTINARQRNTQTGAILATSQIVVTSPCVRKDGAGREATTADALDVTVLGNPTLSDKVEVEVRGAEGQRLQLRMTDGQGASVSEIAVEKANSVERQTLGLGRSAGMYFLQVITPSKVKTVKVIRQ